MKKSKAIDVSLPVSVYTQLHARAGQSGQSMNDVIVDALTGAAPKIEPDTRVPFLANLPADVHAKLKAKAGLTGQTMRALIDQACAASVGMEVKS